MATRTKAAKTTTTETTTKSPAKTDPDDVLKLEEIVDDGPDYDMEAPAEQAQTILTVKKLGDWINENYSGGGVTPDPRAAEVYYFSDKVKKFGDSVFSDGTAIYFAPLVIVLMDSFK
jgi:hypothetical protein